MVDIMKRILFAAVPIVTAVILYIKYGANPIEVILKTTVILVGLLMLYAYKKYGK